MFPLASNNTIQNTADQGGNDHEDDGGDLESTVPSLDKACSKGKRNHKHRGVTVVPEQGLAVLWHNLDQTLKNGKSTEATEATESTESTEGTETTETAEVIEEQERDRCMPASVPAAMTTATKLELEQVTLEPDQRSVHGSCPVTKGEKWVMQFWIRNKPFEAFR